jgi:Tfp pilus assembly protein PilE
MRLASNRRRAAKTDVATGFTILEVVIGVAAVGLLFVTFYTGFTQGFAVIQTARENLRATQILEEKMETIRLYRWEQVTDDEFIPDTFTAPFYAVGTNVAAGVTYQGALTITNVSMPEASYATNMRMVIVQLRWNSGNVERFREMRTLVTRYGLQQYIY